MQYGTRHQGKGVSDFWQYVFFTDEAYIDPSSTIQGHILREQGTRYDSRNIQERGEKQGIMLYIAAWINWYSKTDKLEFYNDETDYIQKPELPRKPRRTMYESTDDFSIRIQEWEAARLHDKEVKTKGNAMTQIYYIERLLPVYINAIHQARQQNLLRVT
ncbi:uncharacterized protein BP5553_04839 [Venustampulla echinocandica]|uniref:Uncharacterized protein n=1 Tax=Venustampulla echinocandica TaxID=2656787 RepID=A0A370TPF7_9HELO|nr:uncharacterized protein BP5553_04839 [Venustampulla echinocandica]RDL37406.1 hypothetical protein BP5553_04839 [Venustampulla echinocandica]